jgi:hypothetical protein
MKEVKHVHCTGQVASSITIRYYLLQMCLVNGLGM